MAKEVLLFNGEAIPAHIAKRMAEAPANIEDRISVPTLGYGGKQWAITLNGETTKLQKRDSEGDLIDLTVFRGIIIDFAKRRGRAYYVGAYNPDKPGKPQCWSDDGITPCHDVPTAGLPETEAGKTVTKCGECPFAEKGSKVNELGKAVTACSEHRMLAVIPHNKPDFTPLRLKLSITSDFDGQSPELEAEDWFAFSNYKDAMRARGVTNTAFIVTKMRMDPNKKHPKVIFQWGGWVDNLGEGVQDKILALADSPEVKKLLMWGSLDAPAEAAPQAKPKAIKAANDDDEVVAKPKKRAVPDDDDEVVAKPKKRAVPDDDDEVVAKPKKRAVPDDDDEVVAKKPVTESKPFSDDDIEMTTTPKAQQAAVAAKQAAKKKVADDDDDVVVIAKPKKAAPPITAKKEAAPVGEEMTSLIGKWNTDDDE